MLDPGKYNDAAILVTGGAGMIGRNLVAQLSQYEPREIVIVDDLSASHEWNIPKRSNITFVKGSILNDETLSHVFRRKPAYVFHLAAHFANQNSVDHPETDLLVNGMGLLKVLEHARQTGVKRFVYTSSGCGVYGLESKQPYSEQDISISLHTPYQVTKMLGELYANYYFNLFSLPIVNARLFNVYGPGEVPGRYRNVIPNFMYWAIHRQPLPITGDGTEIRDWTYVGDIVNGLLTMGTCDAAIGEAINLGSGNETTVIELANMINELTGNSAGIVHAPMRNWDKKRRILSSIDKAIKILNYSPKTELRSGIDNVARWFAENQTAIENSVCF